MNEFLEQKLKNLPKTSGVYLMRNKSGQVIYVGKAKNLKNRVGQYFLKGKKNFKISTMIENVFDVDYFLTLNELDALALENNLIKKHQPHYNVLLKDGKAFAYIKINLNEPFPKFEITRKLNRDGVKYFGPYFSGISASEVLKTINLAYPLRTCNLKLNTEKKQKRECLNYSLGLCSAPCTHRISSEDYHKIVQRAIKFLSGSDFEIKKTLSEKMIKFSEKENFEQAMIFRERLKMLERMNEKILSSLPKFLELDAFACISDGLVGSICVIVCRGGKILGVQSYSIIDASEEKSEILSSFILQYYEKTSLPSEILVSEKLLYKEQIETLLREKSGKVVSITLPQISFKAKLIKMALQNAKIHIENSLSKEKRKFAQTIGALERLQNSLNLKNLPKRIECYDISNLGGTNSVASMVVLENGEPSPKSYRKFKIKTVQGANDFESLKEVLKRRFEHIKLKDEAFGRKPELIVIDGGKGQLSSTLEILFQSGVEGIEIISLAKQFEEVFVSSGKTPVMLERNSAELKLLQNLRDEAHRFAITFHRGLRGKKIFESSLDKIEGLGKEKQKNLFKFFGSIEKIKNASSEELCQVNGIGKKLAEKILEELNKKNDN